MDRAPREDTPAETPPLSLLLGYGPALALLALALFAWLGDASIAAEAVRLLGVAVLLFLAGVQRGLSFFTDGGPRLSQLGAVMVRFFLGLGALVTPLAPALVLLMVGYASVAIVDPYAARTGGAPRFFARLRPVQIAIVEIALIAALGFALR